MRLLLRASLYRVLPGVAVIALLGGPRLLEAHAAAVRRAEDARSRAQRSGDSSSHRTAGHRGNTSSDSRSKSDGRTHDSRGTQDSPSISAGIAATCVCKPDSGESAPVALATVGGPRFVPTHRTPDQAVQSIGPRPAQGLHRAAFDAHAPPAL